MNVHYPPKFVAATADDVLAILVDQHRQTCQLNFEPNPEIALSYESTIADWRLACDLLPWRKLARALNEYWKIDIPLSEWKDVLEPPKVRRLQGVCELLARHIEMRRVRPVNLLGASCLSGGAFLTIRSLLADAGADVDALSPSTDLHDYLQNYPRAFLGPISELAPGKLPLVTTQTSSGYDMCLYLILASLGGLGLSGIVGSPVATIVSIAVLVISCLAVWITDASPNASKLEFPGVATFRDLSRIIASSESASAHN